MRCSGGCGRGDIPLIKVGGLETLSDITALRLGPCWPMRPEGQVTPSVLAGLPTTGWLTTGMAHEGRQRARAKQTTCLGVKGRDVVAGWSCMVVVVVVVPGWWWWIRGGGRLTMWRERAQVLRMLCYECPVVRYPLGTR